VTLGIIIAAILFYGIQRYLNSTLPISHSVALVGLPRSGKTTIITSLFGEIFARKTLYKDFQASLTGESTIKRVNSDLARLERGLTLGPTEDQSTFAYKTKITLTRFFVTRTYKIEFGDFPGEYSKDFLDSQFDLIQSEEFFKWVLSADAIIFVVDLGPYLDLNKRKKYVAEMSASIRSAWQKILNAHEDGERVARKMPVAMVFSKVDLEERIRKIESVSDIQSLIAKLGYGDESPEPIVLDSVITKRLEAEVEKSFTDLLNFLRDETKYFTIVHTSCFGFANENRLGLFELLKAILPK
jgi:GTPase SAR1 family protein